MMAERHPAAPRLAHFDPLLSLRLDVLIIALESSPDWNRRAWLRFQKRLVGWHCYSEVAR